jgi:hypothetical protein
MNRDKSEKQAKLAAALKQNLYRRKIYMLNKASAQTQHNQEEKTIFENCSDSTNLNPTRNKE